MADEKLNFSVRRTITIARPAQELYDLCRSLDAQPHLVPDLEAVEHIDAIRSRWRLNLRGIGRRQWQAVISQDEPGRMFTWTTEGDADIAHEGTFIFKAAPRDLGTEVTLEIRCHLVGGQFTNAMSKIIGRSPEDFISRILHGLQQLAETGEVATNEGPSGRHRRRAMAGVK